MKVRVLDVLSDRITHVWYYKLRGEIIDVVHYLHESGYYESTCLKGHIIPDTHCTVIEEEVTKAIRYNEGKREWGLVHFKSIEPMVEVLEKGAKKYAANNWMGGFDRTKLLESAMRHLTALIDGEDNDPDFGGSHIGNLMCNCMFFSFHFVISEEEREKAKSLKLKHSEGK